MLSVHFHTYTKHHIMNKGTEMLESILLLQQMDTPQKIPMYHYVLDYTLTAIFLTAYGFTFYALINWLWA